MNPLPIRFLAAALMVVVFVCGFLSGRLTAPRADLAGPPAEAAGVQEESTVDRRVMKRYAEELGLSREQVRAVRPLFTAAGRRMLPLGRNSGERLKELERFHEELDPHLTADQKIKARAMLDQALEMKRGASESSR